MTHPDPTGGPAETHALSPVAALAALRVAWRQAHGAAERASIAEHGRAVALLDAILSGRPVPAELTSADGGEDGQLPLDGAA